MLGKGAYFVFFFFAASFFLFADDLDNIYQATVDGGPSGMIEGCVSVITGRVYINDTDIIAEGKQSVYYSKFYTDVFWVPADYSSYYGIQELEEACNLGWGSEKHYAAAVVGLENGRKIAVYEPNGMRLTYHFPEINPPKNKVWQSKEKRREKKEDFENRKKETRYLNLIKKPFYQKSITCAKDNYKNITVAAEGEHDLNVFFPNGTVRHYYRKDAAGKAYFLVWEILPNGNKYEYSADENGINKVISKSPAGKTYSQLDVNIEVKNKKKHALLPNCHNEKKVRVATSAGKYINYDYSLDKKTGRYFLNAKNSTYGNEHFTYCEATHRFLKDYILPNNRVLNINYEKKTDGRSGDPRVAELKSFPKTNEGLKTIYKFTYGKAKEWPEINAVEDACGNVTKYYVNEKRKIEKIQQYENVNGIRRLKKTQLYEWGCGQQESFLIGVKALDENNNQIRSVKNEYDAQGRGNIIKRTVAGNITGKNRDESCFEEYAYSNNNQIRTKTDPNGLQTCYTYLTCRVNGVNIETNLPATKFIKYQNKIKQRTFYDYDSDNILIKEITDDGASEDVDDITKAAKRLIKKIIPRNSEPFGLTDTLEEYYLDFETGKEKLLGKEKYEYSKSCKVTARQIYGSDNQHKYTLRYAYDERDNLIEETDPLGRTALYKYDENSNKTYEKNFEGKEFYYEYDLWNRLIKKTIADEKKYTEEYEYDLKNNKIFQKDIYGNITRYEYNVFGLVTKEIQPQAEDENGKMSNPVWEYAYNLISRDFYT